MTGPEHYRKAEDGVLVGTALDGTGRRIDLHYLSAERACEILRETAWGGLLDLSRNVTPGKTVQLPASPPCSVCGQPFTPGVFYNHDPETGAVQHRGECPAHQDEGA